MTPELAWIFSIFLAPCKAKAQFGQLPPPRAARTVVGGLIWPFSLAFGRTPPSVALERMSIGLSRWRWWWLRSQFCDQPQNLLEHLPWDSDLGHLEDDVTAVAHDLRADLDQLLLQARQRPVLTWGGPGQGGEIQSRISETPVVVSVSKV